MTPTDPFPQVKTLLSNRQVFWLATAFLAIANLVLFWWFLSPSTHWVISSDGQDLSGQFLWWRQFGFDELKKGHLALWNPYLYCGEPFFGGFQSALLYPPNWLFMVLPLPFAVNLSIVLHVFMAGWFTYLWAGNRGARWESALVVSFSFMWGGAYFLHLVPGHLSNLCAMVWIPLIFMAVDRYRDKRDVFSLGIGMAALALQVFSGHIQYVYYTLLALSLYILMDLSGVKRKTSYLCGLGLMFSGALLLSAVQLFAGWDAAFESARGGTMTMDYVNAADLTPERLWCLFMPNLYGDWNSYWGGGLFWEGGLATGLTVFSAALFALFRSEHPQKRTFGFLGLILILLAIGKRGPLLPFFFRFVPLFSHFRGIGKFNILISLCLAALAVMGLDEVMNHPPSMEKFHKLLLGACVSFLGLGLVIGLIPPDSAFFHHYGNHSGDIALKCSIAGLTLGALSWTAWAARRRPLFRYGFLLLALSELFFFAHNNLPSFDFTVQAQKTQVLRDCYATEKGDYRVFATKKDYSLGAGALDIWGDDPAVTARYTNYVESPKEDGTQALIRGLVRLRYVFRDEGDHYQKHKASTLEMPRAFLAGRYEVVSPDSVISKVTDKHFNPKGLVYLESDPGIPQAGKVKGGSVEVKDLSTDAMEVTAHCPASTVLVITDNYSRGWRAAPISDSQQKSFQVLPADGFLRAVPLEPGNQHFLLEYRPEGFEAGKWISLASWFLFIPLLIWNVRKKLI